MNTTPEKIRNFLASNFKQHEFAADEDIFASGFVNSLFAMQLVLFIEDSFGVTVENDDLNLDNFRSINAMTSFVDSKTTVKA